MRKALFWLHLSAGVVAGSVILVMSVTGVLLAFEKQITAWVERDARHVGAPPTATTRLPVEQLLARATGEGQPAPSSITLHSDPGAAATVAFGREGVLFLNPYTGEVTGGGARRVRAFFHAVTDWHRWLGAHGTSRPWARGVTGACNLAFLVLIVTGPVLWWPRDWSWRHLKPILLFQRGANGRARDFNWHNVIGVWSALPLFLIVACAVVISYPWANDLLYRFAGEPPPPARSAETQTRRTETSPSTAGIEPLWSVAFRQVAGWKSITLRLPTAPDAPAIFTIDQGDGGRPQLRSQLTLARSTGEVVRFEPFQSLGPGRRLRTWARWTHTGEAAGLAGQGIAFVASAGASVLTFTGLTLAWRRMRAWRSRRSSFKPQVGRADNNVLEEAS